jgi:hypothetical protein
MTSFPTPVAANRTIFARMTSRYGDVYLRALVSKAARSSRVSVMTKGLRLGGYSRKTATSQGSRLLSRVNVQRAILELNNRRTTQAILTADQTDRILSAIANDPEADLHARIRAIAELNRCRGRHFIKHVIDGHATLEMLLAESRGIKLVGGGNA